MAFLSLLLILYKMRSLNKLDGPNDKSTQVVQTLPTALYSGKEAYRIRPENRRRGRIRWKEAPLHCVQGSEAS